MTDRSPMLRAVTHVGTIKHDESLQGGGYPNNNLISRQSTMGDKLQFRNSSVDGIKEAHGTETAFIDSRISIPMVNLADSNHQTLEKVITKPNMKIGISLYTHRKEEPEALNEEHSFEVMKPAKVESPFSAGDFQD